jgi:hypothetical protein
MSDYEKKKLDADLKKFANRNFELPSNCKNMEQIRFYVRELCQKIDEYQTRFNYVPEWAYEMLVQYNQVQNRILLINFQKAYHLRPAA